MLVGPSEPWFRGSKSNSFIRSFLIAILSASRYLSNHHDIRKCANSRGLPVCERVLHWLYTGLERGQTEVFFWSVSLEYEVGCYFSTFSAPFYYHQQQSWTLICGKGRKIRIYEQPRTHLPKSSNQ